MAVIIGIDIGTKNFSLCARDRSTGTVQRWECVELGTPKSPIADLIKNLCRVLEDFVSETDAHFCIERQPPIARTVSHVLMGAVATWAEVHGVPYELVNPVQKGGTYRERKAQSVRTVREELEKGKEQKNFLTWFQKLSKKDDAADAFLLAGAGSVKLGSAATDGDGGAPRRHGKLPDSFRSTQQHGIPPIESHAM